VPEPFLPPPAHSGRHRAWPMREVVNAIFHVLRGGVPWRMLPEHFPPHQTRYRRFVRFRDTGLWETINHHLAMLDRERAGREASPAASIINTQSVRTTEAGGRRGYDAAKKITRRKRHALVNTDGRDLKLKVQPASVQDRERVFADSSMLDRSWPRQPGSSWRSSAGWPTRSASRCWLGVGRSSVSGLDQSQLTPGEGLRGHRRVSDRVS
jgi:transposase